MATRSDLLRQMQQQQRSLNIHGILNDDLAHANTAAIRFKMRAQVIGPAHPSNHPGGHWSVPVRILQFECTNTASLRRRFPQGVTGHMAVVSVFFVERGPNGQTPFNALDMSKLVGTCSPERGVAGEGYVCYVSIETWWPASERGQLFIVSRNACIIKSSMAALRRLVKFGIALRKLQIEAAERSYAPGGAGYEEVQAQTQVGR